MPSPSLSHFATNASETVVALMEAQINSHSARYSLCKTIYLVRSDLPLSPRQNHHMQQLVRCASTTSQPPDVVISQTAKLLPITDVAKSVNEHNGRAAVTLFLRFPK